MKSHSSLSTTHCSPDGSVGSLEIPLHRLLQDPLQLPSKFFVLNLFLMIYLAAREAQFRKHLAQIDEAGKRAQALAARLRALERELETFIGAIAPVGRAGF